MKKFHYIMSALLILILLTACGSSETSTSDLATTTSTQDSTTGDITTDTTTDINSTDIDADLATTNTPESKADVSGVVSSIIGNEITVSLLAKNNENVSESSTEELTDEEKAEKQAEKQTENQAKRDAGETGSGMTDITLSGETVDFIIPVGTPVMLSSGTGELVRVNIADIMKGASIKVWTLEGGEGEVAIATYVQLLTQ